MGARGTQNVVCLLEASLIIDIPYKRIASIIVTLMKQAIYRMSC